MKLYHSSPCVIELPDTQHSRKELDFGPGFYLTPIRKQAEKYAAKFLRRGKDAFLNIYDMDETWESWCVKVFECYDEEWLDFIIECRKGHASSNYDMVVGGIANDKVFETIDLFSSGLLPKAETLQRLKYERPNSQYCIRSEDMIGACLRFKKAIKL